VFNYKHFRNKERTDTLIDTDELSSISSVKSTNELWESIDARRSNKNIGFNDNKWSEQTPHANAKDKKGRFGSEKATYEELEETRAMIEM